MLKLKLGLRSHLSLTKSDETAKSEPLLSSSSGMKATCELVGLARK